MSRSVHGVVRGRLIELSEDPCLADGQQVELIISKVTPSKPWGEGLSRCAGALAEAWSEEDDRILAQLHRERQDDARPDLPR